MSGRPSRSQVRRGLLVGLDGLAVWVLAIGLESYLSGAGFRLGSDLSGILVDRTVFWLTSPGIGPFELAAYAGLALTLVGPAWYWLGAGVFGFTAQWARASGSPTGFDYGHEPTASTIDSGQGTPTTPSSIRVPNAMPTGSGAGEWVDDVFDMDSGPDQQSAGLATATFSRPSAGTAQRQSPGNGLADGGNPVSEPSSEEDRSTSRVPDDDSDRPDGTEPSSPRDTETGAESTTTGMPDRTVREKAEPSETKPEPADSIDALAETISTQQTAIAGVSARITAATAEQPDEAIDRHLASPPTDTLTGIEALRVDLDSATTDLQTTLEAIRADQARLKSALADATPDN